MDTQTQVAPQEQAKKFVKHLFTNPALSAIIPLQREEQIIQFLSQNSKVLAPTLTRVQFPGKTWSQVLSELLTALREITDGLMYPLLEEQLSRISLNFIPLLGNGNYQASPSVKEQVLALLKKLLERNEPREIFIGSHSAVHYGVSSRYVDAIFDEKSYIHFELTKVEKLKMGKEEIKNMLNLVILLRPAIYLITPEFGAHSGGMGGLVRSSFTEKVFPVLRKELPALPEPVIRSVLNSYVSFEENNKIEATARLASMLSQRCRTYKPNIKVDKGAETPDKSWFYAIRKNYRRYGFDIKMLDELYKISAEYGW
ncbi:hypothetical protein WKV44_05515 [Spirochaetia bacterium 38H-sp]|uniref:Uncharacterized protein n=1 Tax=Rarispira pelagica TaxID=3141764 RepID=A0ABU9UBF0_9SPIR